MTQIHYIKFKEIHLYHKYNDTKYKNCVDHITKKYDDNTTTFHFDPIKKN